MELKIENLEVTLRIDSESQVSITSIKYQEQPINSASAYLVGNPELASKIRLAIYRYFTQEGLEVNVHVDGMLS